MDRMSLHSAHLLRRSATPTAYVEKLSGRQADDREGMASASES